MSCFLIRSNRPKPEYTCQIKIRTHPILVFSLSQNFKTYQIRLLRSLIQKEYEIYVWHQYSVKYKFDIDALKKYTRIKVILTLPKCLPFAKSAFILSRVGKRQVFRLRRKSTKNKRKDRSATKKADPRSKGN